MKGEKAREYSNDNIIDSIKEKFKDSTKEFVKKKIKNDIVNTLREYERKIEKKVRYEIKKFSYTFSGLLLLGFGVLFVLHSIFGYVTYFNELPEFATNFFFGVFLLFLGLAFYLVYK